MKNIIISYSNEALLETAIDVFQEERNVNPHCSILIITDRIEDANNLVTLYNENEFNIGVIHSKRTSSVNEGLIIPLDIRKRFSYLY